MHGPRLCAGQYTLHITGADILHLEAGRRELPAPSLVVSAVDSSVQEHLQHHPPVVFSDRRLLIVESRLASSFDLPWR